jgi:uncharacterized protein (UPF0212 family)
MADGGMDNTSRAEPVTSDSSGRRDQRTATESFGVVFSMPWLVQGVSTGQDAINIAVSEVGKRVSSGGQHVKRVDIDVQHVGCLGCGSGSEALLLVGGTALVGLLLEVVVATPDAERAETFARRELGPNLPDTPLVTVESNPDS